MAARRLVPVRLQRLEPLPDTDRRLDRVVAKLLVAGMRGPAGDVDLRPGDPELRQLDRLARRFGIEHRIDADALAFEPLDGRKRAVARAFLFHHRLPCHTILYCDKFLPNSHMCNSYYLSCLLCIHWNNHQMCIHWNNHRMCIWLNKRQMCIHWNKHRMCIRCNHRRMCIWLNKHRMCIGCFLTGRLHYRRVVRRC